MELVRDSGRIMVKSEQKDTKIKHRQDLSEKESYEVFKDDMNYFFNKNTADSQVVPGNQETILEPAPFSAHHFEDPARFMIRPPEKSTRSNGNTRPQSLVRDNKSDKSATVAENRNGLKKNLPIQQIFGKKTELVVPDEESSTFGGRDVVGASKDRSHYYSSRKRYENYEGSTDSSDDMEDELESFTREVPSWTSKRFNKKGKREANNLFKKRRRNKINKKMRELQDLIPNSIKVDKASVLDEAIVYLKTLQLQIQMMTMRAGLYMHPMVSPMGMQQINTPYFPYHTPMPMGMLMAHGYIPVDFAASSSSVSPATALSYSRFMSSFQDHSLPKIPQNEEQ